MAEEFLAGALIGSFLIGIIVILLISYIITAISLMKIAQKTQTENSWLAWIPIANIFLMVFIAKKEWWWALLIILIGIIPFIGGIISLGLAVYIWWLIVERLGKPGPLSLLILIPVVNLGFMLYLAFSE